MAKPIDWVVEEVAEPQGQTKLPFIAAAKAIPGDEEAQKELLKQYNLMRAELISRGVMESK